MLQKRFRIIAPAIAFLALILALMPAGCAADKKAARAPVVDPAPEVAPLYYTDGKFIRDSAGRAMIVRGINVSNQYKGYGDDPGAEPEGIGPDAYQKIADGGINMVRLVTEWYALEPSPGTYTTAYLDLVAERVRWATDAGLMVVVDFHQDVFGPGFGGNGAPLWACDQSYYDTFEGTSPWFANYFQPEVMACFDNFWQSDKLKTSLQQAAAAVAEKIADNELVLGFDTFNEPFPGSVAENFEPDYLAPYHQGFARTVGKKIPERVFFFEPSVIFNLSIDTALPGPVTAFAGVFAPHYYNPSVELGLHYDGSGSDVGNAVARAREHADRMEVPLVYGEIGGASATDNLADYLRILYAALDREMVGGVLWDYSHSKTGFGVIDSDSGDWNRHAAAYLRISPYWIAGDPIGFSWSDIEGEFVLDWTENPNAGDTVISLPVWVSQVGYALTVDREVVEPVLNEAGNRIIIAGGVGGERRVEIDVAGGYPAP